MGVFSKAYAALRTGWAEHKPSRSRRVQNANAQVSQPVDGTSDSCGEYEEDDDCAPFDAHSMPSALRSARRGSVASAATSTASLTASLASPPLVPFPSWTSTASPNPHSSPSVYSTARSSSVTVGSPSPPPKPPAVRVGSALYPAPSPGLFGRRRREPLTSARASACGGNLSQPAHCTGGGHGEAPPSPLPYPHLSHPNPATPGIPHPTGPSPHPTSAYSAAAATAAARSTVPAVPSAHAATAQPPPPYILPVALPPSAWAGRRRSEASGHGLPPSAPPPPPCPRAASMSSPALPALPPGLSRPGVPGWAPPGAAGAGEPGAFLEADSLTTSPLPAPSPFASAAGTAAMAAAGAAAACLPGAVGTPAASPLKQRAGPSAGVGGRGAVHMPPPPALLPPRPPTPPPSGPPAAAGARAAAAGRVESGGDGQREAPVRPALRVVAVRGAWEEGEGTRGGDADALVDSALAAATSSPQPQPQPQLQPWAQARAGPGSAAAARHPAVNLAAAFAAAADEPDKDGDGESYYAARSAVPPFSPLPMPPDGTLFVSPACPAPLLAAREAPARRSAQGAGRGWEAVAWCLEQFAVQAKLYSGYASTVYKASCALSGHEVVLKAYDLAALTPFLTHQVLRELSLHSRLRHPGIVQLHAAFKEADTLVLVLEYVRGGSLDRVRRKLGGRLSEGQAGALVLRPLLAVLAHLHSRGVVHRDIKPENVLFTPDWRLRLCDFGVALCLAEERAVTRTGSREYMAPEVNACPLKRGPDDNKDSAGMAYSPAADVWSLGALLYELLVGFTPFPGGPPPVKLGSSAPAPGASTCATGSQATGSSGSGDRGERTLGGGGAGGGGGREGPAEEEPASRLVFPGGVSPGARALVRSCLALHPADRPTVRQLLSHPWLMQALEEEGPEAAATPDPAPRLRSSAPTPAAASQRVA